MTREAKIYLESVFPVLNAKMQEAIKALWTEQESIEVEATELQKAYNKGFEDCRRAVLEQAMDYGSQTYLIPVNSVKALPPVNPQPRTGHWINIEDRTDWYDAAYKCSCCGREIITPYELKNNLYSDYPYCHCGAKMVEERE